MKDEDIHIGDNLWLCFLQNKGNDGYYRIILTQVHVTGHLPPGTKKCYRVEKACGLSEHGTEHIMYQMGMGKGEFYTAVADELWPTEYEALKHTAEELSHIADDVGPREKIKELLRQLRANVDEIDRLQQNNADIRARLKQLQQ